jgi:hypothetical protein
MLLLFTALFVLVAGSVQAYERLEGPTELLYWDQARAYNGYTLFGVGGTRYLIDMEGQVVHMWRLGTNPRLLENGNLLDATKDDPSGFQGFAESQPRAVDRRSAWNALRLRGVFLVTRPSGQRYVGAPYNGSLSAHGPDRPTAVYAAEGDRSVSSFGLRGAVHFQPCPRLPLVHPD